MAKTRRQSCIVGTSGRAKFQTVNDIGTSIAGCYPRLDRTLILSSPE
jgi:hypothetical protein